MGEEATYCKVLLALADLFDMMGANGSRQAANLQLIENCLKCMLQSKEGFSAERDQEMRKLVGFVNTAKLSEASAGEKAYKEWRKKLAEMAGEIEGGLGRFVMMAAKAEKELGGGKVKYKNCLRKFLEYKQKKGKAVGGGGGGGGGAGGGVGRGGRGRGGGGGGDEGAIFDEDEGRFAVFAVLDDCAMALN